MTRCSFTFSAAAAAVAGLLHAAGLTALAEPWLILFRFGNGVAPGVRELKNRRPALIAQTGLERLLTLYAVSLHAVGPAVQYRGKEVGV